MSPRRSYLLFSGLYLLSFAVLTGWLILLIVGLLANSMALPTLLGSVVCLEVFRRLARRAEERLH